MVRRTIAVTADASTTAKSATLPIATAAIACEKTDGNLRLS